MNGISFRRLKVVIKSKGYSLIEFAEKCGVMPNRISMICNDRTIPKTDFLAKMCSILKVYPSEICSFDGLTVNERYFNEDTKPKLPEEFTGELTYQPMWMFLVDYLAEYNFDHNCNKKENDLFDQIEPPRRLKGYSAPVKEAVENSMKSRYGEGYKSERTNRTDYSKGLPQLTRTKLRNDRPLNLAVIYEICKKLQCSIDWIVAYK